MKYDRFIGGDDFGVLIFPHRFECDDAAFGAKDGNRCGRRDRVVNEYGVQKFYALFQCLISDGKAPCQDLTDCELVLLYVL